MAEENINSARQGSDRDGAYSEKLDDNEDMKVTKVIGKNDIMADSGQDELDDEDQEM